MIAVLALLSSVFAASPNSNAYAIVIGVNEPPKHVDSALPKLRYADDDAVRWYQLLRRVAREVRVYSALDSETAQRYPELARTVEPPRLERVLAGVESIAKTMEMDLRDGEQPVFYFVFSGHGALSEDGNAFLALQGGELTRSMLYDAVLSKIPAHLQHLIIDACYARSVIGLRGESPFALELETEHRAVTATEARSLFPQKRDLPSLGVLIASTKGQEAFEWSEMEAGVFSHLAISALLGAADVNRDARIEYSEVQAFVGAASGNLRDPRAIPNVIAVPPASDPHAPLIALDAIPEGTLLVGDASGLGHFHLELENGQRYLDAHLNGELQLSLLLPPESVLFLRTPEAEAELFSRRGGARIDIADLELRPRSVLPRGSIDRAYREGLFSASYGRTYYREFVARTGAISVAIGPEVSVVAPPVEDRVLPIALGSGAAALGLLSAISGVIAVNARGAFHDTELQVPAREAAERFELHANVSLVSGIAAVALGVAAWIVWPKDQVEP